jgi:hypothetical protein
MSRRHGQLGRTTPRRPRIDRTTAQAAATIAALMRGCECDPTFRLRHDHGDGLDNVQVVHTAGCPALDNHAVVIYAATRHQT